VSLAFIRIACCRLEAQLAATKVQFLKMIENREG